MFLVKSSCDPIDGQFDDRVLDVWQLDEQVVKAFVVHLQSFVLGRSRFKNELKSKSCDKVDSLRKDNNKETTLRRTGESE
jgi:hypothetical protein